MSKKNGIKSYTTSNGNTYKCHGGFYTGYGFERLDGKPSVLGFDSKPDLKAYLEMREAGFPHFMDDISDLPHPQQTKQ